MSFFKSHSIVQYDYFIDIVILQRINQVEDFDLIFTPTLSFIDWNLEYWTEGKILRALEFIRRHAQDPITSENYC